MKIKTLLIDLDDNILPSGHTYFIPQLNCAKILTMEFQPDCPRPEVMIAEARRISKSLFDLPGPKELHIFAKSWIIYHLELAKKLGRPASPAISDAITMEAVCWLKDKYELYPGTREVLEKIKQQKILVTLGNESGQRHKIITANIESLFDGIEIMNNKNQDTFKTIMEKYKLKPKTTAMIGDSFESDIQPAIDCGIHAYHVIGKFEKPNITGIHPFYTAISHFNEITSYI